MTGFISKCALRTAALSLAIAATSATVASAADKITIIVGGMEKQIYLPAVLTQQLGYFKDQGLDVELLNSRAGVEAENELLAGAVQGVVGFYDHTVDLQSKGKYIQSIVQFSQAPGEVELVSAKHPEIKSPADFKGATLGVTGLGSSTDFLTQYLAVRSGLKPGDYTLLPVGAGNTFIAAVKQDQIQAGMTTEPTIAKLLKTGEASILVDMRTPEKTKEALGGDYPAASFYVQSSWLEGHKDEAQKLANAFVKTMKFIATHHREADLTGRPRANGAIACTPCDRLQINAASAGCGMPQHQRRSRWRIDLVAMMRLDNLHVPVIGVECPRRLLDQSDQHVEPE